MTLVNDLTHILDEWSIREGALVIAVSGGADSVALLHMIAAARTSMKLLCAHVNQGLRGNESEEDARFVEEQAGRLGIEFRIASGRPSEEMIRQRGVEGAARIARYDALRSIRDETGAGWIATAHTADDQAETVLMRILGNAGIETLSAILPRTPDGVVRPLLRTRRVELREWLSSRGLEHRVDSTNLDARFVRNRIRLELLPALEQQDPSTVTRLAQIADHVAAIRDLVDPTLETLSRKWAREAKRSVIDPAVLPRDRDLRRLMLLEEIRRFVPAGRAISGNRLETLPDELRLAPRISLGNGLSATLQEDLIGIGPDDAIAEPFSAEISAGQTVHLPESAARMTIRRVGGYAELTNHDRTLQVFTLPDPSDNPSFTVRNRVAGDRFQPLGFDHAKKLKDVLIDRKIPARLRDRIPLLVYADEIVWVPGVEVSERFRVEPGRDLFEVRIDYDEVNFRRTYEEGHYGGSDRKEGQDARETDPRGCR